MNKVTSDRTLSLIVQLDNVYSKIHEYATTLKDIKALKEKAPAVLIDKSDDLKQSIIKIGEALPVILQNLKELKYLYRMDATLCRELRKTLLEKIDERRNTEMQANTMVSLYDERNLITDITISHIGSFDEVDIDPSRSIRMDQMVDPKDYSCHALVKKFESENSTIDSVFDIFEKNFDISISSVQSDILRISDIRDAYEDGEIALMLTNPDTPSEKIISLVNKFFYMGHLTSIRDRLQCIFQISMEIQHNYKVYTEAVKTYTSITLESVFNPNSTYEI